MDAIFALAIANSIADIGIFALYNKDILRNRCRPNIASWLLWSVLGVLSCTSYLVMTGDWIKSVLGFASAMACIATLVFSLFKDGVVKLETFDYCALSIGALAVLCWLAYKSSTYANLILSTAYTLSFIPTYRSVWKDSKREKSLPWVLWTAIFGVQIAIVLLRRKGQYQDIAGPISGAIQCGIMPILILRKTQNREEKI